MARKSVQSVKSTPVQNPNTGIVTPQIKWVGGDGRTPPNEGFFDAAATAQRAWLPVPPLPPIEGVETEVECGPLVKGV